MIAADIQFKLIDSYEQALVYDAIDNLLQAMRMNGQISSKEWGVVFLQDVANVRILIPELISLNQNHANSWVNARIDTLKNMGVSNMRIEIIGNDYIDDLCPCENPSAYILYTYERLMSQALHCRDCFLSVPLYRIPPLKNDEYFDILYWESMYQALDALDDAMGEQMNILVRHELSQVESDTSVWGIGICRQITEQTTIPVYYYLAYGSDTCPSCHQALEQIAWHIFDSVCHTCKIVLKYK